MAEEILENQDVKTEEKGGEEIEVKEAGTPPVEKADEGVSIEDIVSGKPKEDDVQKAKAGTPKWAQKRFDELTSKIKERDAEIETLKASSVPTNRPVPPDRYHFDEETEYQKAMVEWKDKDDDWKASNSSLKSQEKDIETRMDNNVRRYMTNAERMKGKFSDFEETTERVYYEDLAPLILESEFAPEISYFLAKNPAELEKIKTLSPVGMAMEIGKLESRLATVQKKSTTNAPPPFQTLEGNDAPKEEINDKTPIDKWMANEKKQRLAKIKSQFE